MTDLEGRVAGTIRSFSNLPAGWHYGSGVGADPYAVDVALSITSLLIDHRARNIEAFPDLDGGILVCGYHKQDTLEILCRPGGRINYVHEINDELANERENVSQRQVEEYLGELEWRQRSSFVSYTQNITAERKDDLQVWPSKFHQTMEEYPYLRRNAESRRTDANVAISIVSTEESLRIPIFSGASNLTYSQETAGLLANHRLQVIRATETSGISPIINAGV